MRVSKGRIGLLTAVAGILAMTGSLAAADKDSVSGVFKGNGQDAKLAYVSALKGQSFSNKPTIVMVFTEKDHSKDKDSRTNAIFGKHGCALVITINEDGKIVGCQVVHNALKHDSFGTAGVVKMGDFKLENGKLQGKLSTGGEDDFFGDKWEVDIKFQVQAP
jgi:hypothetical protein